jgi:hypothetical protein
VPFAAASAAKAALISTPTTPAAYTEMEKRAEESPIAIREPFFILSSLQRTALGPSQKLLEKREIYSSKMNSIKPGRRLRKKERC